jgi:hypothetical protein
VTPSGRCIEPDSHSSRVLTGVRSPTLAPRSQDLRFGLTCGCRVDQVLHWRDSLEDLPRCGGCFRCRPGRSMWSSRDEKLTVMSMIASRASRWRLWGVPTGSSARTRSQELAPQAVRMFSWSLPLPPAHARIVHAGPGHDAVLPRQGHRTISNGTWCVRLTSSTRRHATLKGGCYGKTTPESVRLQRFRSQTETASLGALGSWCHAATERWTEWTALCLCARSLGEGHANYRGLSRVNNPSHSLADPTAVV